MVLLRGGAVVAAWPLRCAGPPALGVVDALARLQLEARRHGCSIWLRDACPDLVELLHLVGLGDIVPVGPPPPRAQPT